MAPHRRPPDFDDPLDERPTCRGGWEGGACDGWVYVSDRYPEQQKPGCTGELRAKLSNSVYPCKVHRAPAFFRWAGNHYAPNHDVYHCPECIDAHKGRMRSRDFDVERPPDHAERAAGEG